MPTYTLWSRGALLGESPLDTPAVPPGCRAGAFWPTAAGEALLPVLTGLTPAVTALNAMLEREGVTQERLGTDLPLAMRDALRTTAEGAHLAAAQEALAALALEVRDPDGVPLRVRSITVGDQRAFMQPEMVELLVAALAEEGMSPYQLVLLMEEGRP